MLFRSPQVSNSDASKDNTAHGRANNLDAKREVIEALLATWQQAPQLLLGQLIGNVVSDEKRLYYLEDRMLVEELATFYAGWKVR